MWTTSRQPSATSSAVCVVAAPPAPGVADVETVVAEYQQSVLPIRFSLGAMLLSLAAATAVALATPGDTNRIPPLGAILGGLIGFVALPGIELYRGRASFAAVLRGSLSVRSAAALGLAGAFASLLYESLNVQSQFGITISQVPIARDLTNFAVIVFGEPFTEELFFQVGLQTSLERVNAVFAIVVSAIVFAAVHALSVWQLASALITHLPFTLALAIVWRRTRSLGACLIIHAGYNLGLFLLSRPL